MIQDLNQVCTALPDARARAESVASHGRVVWVAPNGCGEVEVGWVALLALSTVDSIYLSPGRRKKFCSEFILSVADTHSKKQTGKRLEPPRKVQ